jgi:hypothetical protein
MRDGMIREATFGFFFLWLLFFGYGRLEAEKLILNEQIDPVFLSFSRILKRLPRQRAMAFQSWRLHLKN